MSADANPFSNSTYSDDSLSEQSKFWRAIGRLEGTVNALLELQQEQKEGQRLLQTEMQAGYQPQRSELQAGYQELNAEIKEGFHQLNRRLDQLFWTVLVGGGVLIAALWTSNFV